MQGGKKTVTQRDIEEQFPTLDMELEGTTDAVCVICLEDMRSESKVRRLQCHHTFHAECILKWWVHRPRAVIECPTCKQVQNVNVNLEAPNPNGSQPVLSSSELQHGASPPRDVIGNDSASAAQNGNENETAMLEL